MPKNHYLPFEHFVFRTPLFSYETKHKMNEYLNSNVFNEALYLASPIFSEQKQKQEYYDSKEKMLRSLYKYFSRSYSRCTPFGLFAGCSIGSFDVNTNIDIVAQENYKRRTRLDMNYLCALIQQIEKLPNIQPKLKFYPNDSIYEIGNQIRYVEYYYIDTRRIHQIISVHKTEYLDKILQISNQGATIKELSNSISGAYITYDEAEEFVQEMIAAQLLKSELEIQATCHNPLNRLIGQLQKLEDIPILYELEQIEQLLEKIDQANLGQSSILYEQLIQIIKDIGVGYESKYLFQTDMYKPTTVSTLSNCFIIQFNGLFSFLNKIVRKNNNNSLTAFRDAFYERYEEREIPLPHVMDMDMGIGYPVGQIDAGDVNHIVDDLVIPTTNSNTSLVSFNETDKILLSKYIDAIHSGSRVVFLDDIDFSEHDTEWSDMPNTLSVLCNIVTERKSNNTLVVIKNVGGSNAASLLGRFCHLNSEIYTLAQMITTKEQELEKSAIIAEISHIPESRTGNISMRPPLRDYEIHYLSNSGVELDKQISVADILVSIRNGQIILRSKKHDVEIIPRLTNAHNYSFNSMPIYHFLSDMQNQGLRNALGFNWHGIFDEFSYLPRLQYKNYILSLQRWNIKKIELNEMEKCNDDELLLKIRKLREKYGIPQEIVIQEGDNELYIDLENILSVRTMYSVVKNHSQLSIKEFLLSEFDSPVHGPEGSFCNEFIIPFYKKTK